MATGTPKKKKARKGSLFLGAINSFTTFLYSIFNNGRLGTWLSEDSAVYNGSASAAAIESGSERLKNSKLSATVENTVEKSRVLKLLGAFRDFLFCLSLSVYGVFFMTYGFTSIFVYYLSILLKGSNPYGDSAFIVSALTVACSIPMVASTSSAANYLRESRALKKILRSLLSVPMEKFKVTKKYSGVEIMLPSAFLAMGLGALTFLIHPAYLLIVFVAIILFCAITANPESGIIITIGAVPFMQFTDASEILLVILLTVTGFSYVSKLFRRRRTVRWNAESIFVAFFCGFVLISGMFSPLGALGMLKSVYAALIIFCGFFITYNLMRSEDKLLACTKTLTVAFLGVCLIGLWNVFYDGVVDGVIYSIGEYVEPILGEQSIGFYESSDIFGVLAVLVFPLLLSYTANKKSVCGVVFMLILGGISVGAVLVYGTYETIVALIIEFIIFWFLCSNKTLSISILLLLPVGIFAVIFPYIASGLNWKDPLDWMISSLPLSFDDAPLRASTLESSMAMLMDGNLTGIGVGNEVFQKLHADYASVASSGAKDPGSFFVQLVCWSGIGGLFTFTVFMLLLFKSSYGYMLVSRDKAIRRKTLALFCALFCAMIYGTVNCLWNDMRMLFLFWACAGLLSGFVREGRDREVKIVSEFSDTQEMTDLELRFYK